MAVAAAASSYTVAQPYSFQFAGIEAPTPPIDTFSRSPSVTPQEALTVKTAAPGVKKRIYLCSKHYREVVRTKAALRRGDIQQCGIPQAIAAVIKFAIAGVVCIVALPFLLVASLFQGCCVCCSA